MMVGTALATGCHEIKININDINRAGSDVVLSSIFEVGSHLWRIKILPDGTSHGKPDYISVYLVREDSTALIVKASYEFALLVENKVIFMKTKTCCFKRADSVREFSYKTECGFSDFAKQSLLNKLLNTSKKQKFLIKCSLDIMGTMRPSPALNNPHGSAATENTREAENEVPAPIFSGEMRYYSADTRIRKIWTKIQPCGVLPETGKVKLKLTIYHELQETVINLWNSRTTEPNLSTSDPCVLIFDDEKRIVHRLQSACEGDINQLSLFYNACIGFKEDSIWPLNPLPGSIFEPLEVIDLEMGIQASIETARQEGSLPRPVWPGSSSSSTLPSAPPLNQSEISSTDSASDVGSYGQCSICLDCVADTACVPCGHAAGCNNCMSQIDWATTTCPICRAAVTEIMKIHFV